MQGLTPGIRGSCSLCRGLPGSPTQVALPWQRWSVGLPCPALSDGLAVQWVFCACGPCCPGLRWRGSLLLSYPQRRNQPRSEPSMPGRGLAFGHFACCPVVLTAGMSSLPCGSALDGQRYSPKHLACASGLQCTGLCPMFPRPVLRVQAWESPSPKAAQSTDAQHCASAKGKSQMLFV